MHDARRVAFVRPGPIWRRWSNLCASRNSMATDNVTPPVRVHLQIYIYIDIYAKIILTHEASRLYPPIRVLPTPLTSSGLSVV